MLTAPVYDEEDFQVTTTDDQLGRVAELAQLQMEREDAVAELEEQLKQAKARLAEVQDHSLPDLMEELGLTNFKTKNGLKIEVKESIKASAGKSDPERFWNVCNWLREHGHGNIIKREISLAFGAGEEDRANEFVDLISPVASTLGKDVQDDANIHAATLSKFVGEQLEAGVDIPEYFNVFRQRVAKIVRPK